MQLKIKLYANDVSKWRQMTLKTNVRKRSHELLEVSLEPKDKNTCAKNISNNTASHFVPHHAVKAWYFEHRADCFAASAITHRNVCFINDKTSDEEQSNASVLQSKMTCPHAEFH